ncbi:MAG TPA: glycosyltransferase family 4 protein, partial [Steroidobacteraceae bacterium]|nr:glycosyltransferase family 4 protein [Steroidobacteraceae bacterium]
MNIRSLCIVGMDDYPLLAGSGDTTSVNGESVQHVLLARAWRDLGLDVSMVVHDHGQGPVRMHDGIRAFAAHAPYAGVPVLRFVHPRMTSLVTALTAADADVYYQSPSGSATGVTAWFCRQRGRRMVYRVASDANCVPGRQLIRYWHDRKLYEYGLRRAHLVATQTLEQTSLLLEHYGIGSAAVNMAVELPAAQADRRDIDVLWVSNLRSVKRPELVLELARQLPHVSFTIAGGVCGRQHYYDEVMAAAARLHNVTMLGAVPYARIGALFDRARVFLNTSSVEGFPNTFLQAWVRGTPVVTFFDPDRLVHQQRLG